MHVLPQLRKLEERHRDTLVVIGVHSAKFRAEKLTASVAEAIARYNIGHPVVNDSNFQVWSQYGVRAWPTLMFIDPEGKVVGRHEGEFSVDELNRVLLQMIGEYDAAGLLNRDLLPFQRRTIEREQRTLSFPGKVEVDAENDRLFVADSNHHRVLVTSLDGQVQTIIGNGEVNEFTLEQQGFDDAAFDNPQGMAPNGSTLYVADAGTHTIKLVDLDNETVSVIAGTGEQSLYRHQGGEALANPLNSPFDLGVHGDLLYIAMAGFHQLWSMNLVEQTVQPFAGTGAEAIKDGLRMESMLAQPYGLAVQGSNVFFADSETSSIRLAKIGEGGRVVTLVGTGLFDFGDAEGIGKEAKLQHPQGVAAGRDTVFIADTYNHRIKRMSLSTLKVDNVAGSGRKGNADGALGRASFNEPAGLAVDGNRVWVADTNNHSVRLIDLEEQTVSTLSITGV